MARLTLDMSRKLYFKSVLPEQDRMFRYASAILKDDEVAKDVVQDCLAKLWERRTMLTSIENIRGWLMRIVRNNCLDRFKNQRFGVDPEEILDLSSKDLISDEVLGLKEEYQLVMQAVRALPSKQREIFHLREIEEQTYQEISVIMDISINDVKVSLHRARSSVKGVLEKLHAYGTEC